MWRSLALLSVCLALVGSVLPPPERSYKILMLLPISSKSHRNVFLPLANGLVDRGHKVTMLSNHPLDNKKIENYDHSLPYFREENVNMFEMGRDHNAMFAQMRKMFINISREIYDDPNVKMLWDRKDEFDLFIVDSLFNEALYPFLINKKFILVATNGLDPTHSAVLGNVLNPAYVSNILFDYPQPYSFVNRVKNIIFSIMTPLKWRGAILQPSEQELQKIFTDLPPLLEIEANQSLAFINTHFTLENPTPLLPSQVEIGCMHCVPGKGLPKELLDFISGDQPVVYMSLGSVARSTTIPAHAKEVLLKTFSKLPYKVVWKYEDDSLGKLPDNIMIRKWMPQQDILAHKNVKAFISHCGLLGTHEAMYHATPVVGLPIGADQKKNAARLENSNKGLFLDWDKLTVEMFDAAIKDVVTNDKYHKAMAKASRTFRDQMQSPVDRAVYWSEYVIRHDGARHLKSPASDLTWVQTLHLDVILILHVVMFVVITVVMKMVKLCCGSKKNPKLKTKLKTN